MEVAVLEVVAEQQVVLGVMAVVGSAMVTILFNLLRAGPKRAFPRCRLFQQTFSRRASQHQSRRRCDGRTWRPISTASVEAAHCVCICSLGARACVCVTSTALGNRDLSIVNLCPVALQSLHKRNVIIVRKLASTRAYTHTHTQPLFLACYS